MYVKSPRIQPFQIADINPHLPSHSSFPPSIYQHPNIPGDGAVAFQLGCALRTRLLTFDKPVVIDISTISEPGHVLFRAVTGKGTSLDNDYWVSRKRRAVVRWGVSSWYLGNKFGGYEEAFKAKLGLGERASEVSYEWFFWVEWTSCEVSKKREEVIFF